MPIGNTHGKHIVTIEGVNIEGLNYIQQSFAEEGATQCGFCTPGFIVSLAGFCLNENASSTQNAIDAVNGNICRCTGYKSIERAAEKIATKICERKTETAIDFAIENKILPAYFKTIKERLTSLQLQKNGIADNTSSTKKRLGGGTDLYVQQHETMVHADIDFLLNKVELKGIEQVGNKCVLGASTTVSEVAASPIFQKHFPDLDRYIKLVSSTQIRNMATIAGNFINASPIGDFTIFFLALDAQIILSDGNNTRKIALRNLYKGYKTLDKTPEEFIEKIEFELPTGNTYFNFEKVSKRTNLDIASVNTAISITVKNDSIEDAGLSAGGVGPIPFFLAKTSALLKGKKISVQLINELIDSALNEISPISDARGTVEYKKLLLSQLIKAHFITLFPALQVENLLSAS